MLISPPSEGSVPTVKAPTVGASWSARATVSQSGAWLTVRDLMVVRTRPPRRLFHARRSTSEPMPRIGADGRPDRTPRLRGRRVGKPPCSATIAWYSRTLRIEDWGSGPDRVFAAR